jgi:CBS-domain-containing membrane protein
MTTATEPLLELTASDLMSEGVITIPQDMSLRAAAHLMFQRQIGAAPVVDSDGRCIGLLCANDFVQWVHEGGSGAEDIPLPACPYQTKGRLLSGEEAMMCMLAAGDCRLQEIRPTTGGRHTAICLLPKGSVSKWQQTTPNLPISAVRRYMRTQFETVGPLTRLSELARKMIGAHMHRVFVVDEQRRPIGVVMSTDVMGALAHADTRGHPSVISSDSKENSNEYCRRN